MKHSSITLLVLMGLAAAGCGSEDPLEEDIHTGGTADLVVLDSLQIVSAGITIGTVTTLPPDTLHTTGSIVFDASLVSHVGPRMQGRIRNVPVETGSFVRRGDTLVVLDSPELGAAQAAWFAAAVDLDVDRRNYQRAERLYKQGIISERKHLEAEGDLRRAEGALAAAERALAALGAQPDSTASSTFALTAPLTGIVAGKHATVGEVVGPEDDLFTVGNLSRLWILLDLYESDLTRVSVGAPVVIRTEAYGSRTFDGVVGYVGAVVDTISRTVKVRVVIPNPDRSLKPGMFARADLVLIDSTETIGVPADAVQDLRGKTVVFIPEEPGRFRAREVSVGRTRAGGWVEILEGLSIGDRFVDSGSFALKSDLLKESFGEED